MKIRPVQAVTAVVLFAVSGIAVYGLVRLAPNVLPGGLPGYGKQLPYVNPAILAMTEPVFQISGFLENIDETQVSIRRVTMDQLSLVPGASSSASAEGRLFSFALSPETAVERIPVYSRPNPGMQQPAPTRQIQLQTLIAGEPITVTVDGDLRIAHKKPVSVTKITTFSKNVLNGKIMDTAPDGFVVFGFIQAPVPPTQEGIFTVTTDAFTEITLSRQTATDLEQPQNAQAENLRIGDAVMIYADPDVDIDISVPVMARTISAIRPLPILETSGSAVIRQEIPLPSEE